MLLFIDTSDNEKVRLALVDQQPVFYNFGGVDLSEKLIGHIEKFLKRSGLSMAGLGKGKIAVVTGPGHFSRIRTGVAVANALAYGLNIPVVGVKKKEHYDWQSLKAQKGSKMVRPVYDKAPNITKKSK